MTTDELLEAAREYTRLAIIEGASVGANHEIRELFAQLAQAAAQTAQAMDYHRFIEQWLELSEATTEYNDPAEAREAAFYDAHIAKWRKEQETQA